VSECSKCYDKGYYRVGDADITCWDCCGIVKRAELARLRAEAENVETATELLHRVLRNDRDNIRHDVRCNIVDFLFPDITAEEADRIYDEVDPEPIGEEYLQEMLKGVHEQIEEDRKQKVERAEAEAWRAVRGTYESNAEEVSSVALGSIEDAFKAQIARLDQLKAPTPTGGE